MPKAPITRFSNLVIDTELDPGNEYKIMRCPRLSQKEIDEIPEDGLKGGEIIFNIENDSFQFYDGTSWIASEGTGTVTEINTGTGLTGGPITSTGTIDLTNTGVTSGAYTYANVTVDEQGRVTSISSNPDPEGSGTVTEINTGTGLTGGPITSTGTIDLTNTGVTSGAYTYADVTVDEQGRVTSIASNPTPTTGTVTEISTGTGLTGGPITSTGTIDLTNTGVTSGAYTYADVTVDEQGRVTSIASNPTPTTGTVTEISTGTGLTGGPITSTGTIDLTNTGVTSGAYTYADVTVDEQGRVTSIASNPTPTTGTVTEISTGTGLTGGPITSTGTIDLTNTGVTSGAYTYADVTVDEQGRVTSIASNPTPTTGTVTEISTGTGLTGGPITSTGTIDLTNTGVTSGAYTYANVTVDAQGRVTSISSNPDPEGTGTVTEINTGTGLTGGPITETGTIDLTNTGVTSGTYTYADVTVDAQGRVTNIASNLKEILYGYVSTDYSTHTSTSDHIKFDAIGFERTNGSITLDTSSSYSNSVNTDSIGRITLQPNKTYKLTAWMNNMEASGNSAVSGGWFNSDTNDAILFASSSPEISNRTYGGAAILAYFTPNVTTRVELRIMFAGLSTVRGAYTNGPTYFTIETI